MQVERRNGRAGYEAIHVGAEEKTRVQFDSVLEKTANQHNPGDVASRSRQKALGIRVRSVESKCVHLPEG